MSRNTQANRDTVKSKIASKNKKQQAAIAKRKKTLKEIVNQMTSKKNSLK